jgi:transcription initiation factor TFIID TATA-box-binding protein
MDVPVPHIQNVVATFYLDLSDRLCLATLPSIVPMAHFGPNFAAAMMSILEPKTTCLIFASGKAVCTGAKSKESAIVACNIYVEMLVLCGIRATFRTFVGHNLVYKVQCPFQVDLRALADSNTEWTSYEKGLFPGLSHKVAIPGERKMTTFIVFVSGKCVITGGTDEGKMMAAWRHFYLKDLVRFQTTVNFGSSGNYRMSQNLEIDAEMDWVHQQMVRTIRPMYDLPDDDEDAMQAAFTLEMQIITQVAQEVRDMRPWDETGDSVVYRPFCCA